MRLHVLFSMMLACGCGARSELDTPDASDASIVVDAHLHDVAPEIAPPPIDATPDVSPPPVPLCMAFAGVPVTYCHTFFHVGAITLSSSSCYVDLLVHEGDDALALFSCTDGDATKKFWANADFPGGSFPGAIQGEVIDLCAGTTFTGPDGCTWVSAQEITGNLDGKALTFTYHEHVVAGTGCASPCSASGAVLAQ